MKKRAKGKADRTVPDVQPLYVTERIEVDLDTWAREATNDVDTFIAAAEADADRVLEELRQLRRERTAELLRTAVVRSLLTAEKAATLIDLEPSAPLLAGDAEREGDAVRFAARVKLCVGRLRAAIASNDIQDAVRHAIDLATNVERGQHLQFWGPEVIEHRRREATDRGNIQDHNAKLHQEAAEFWAPWQEEYRALRAARWTKTDARQEIGGRIMAETGREVTDKTLRNWLE
jgi:hypothetical protein